STNEDSCSLLDAADPPDEETALHELRLERDTAFARERDEQPARGLRVVAERVERVVHAVEPHGQRREVAVARVAGRARARTPLRAMSSAPSMAGKRSDSRTNATPLRDAISCACPKRPKPVTSVTAFGEKLRSTSAASLFSVRIQRTARSSGIVPVSLFL